MMRVSWFSGGLVEEHDHRPGSELFIVYNQERDSEAALGIPGLLNRAFIVKINRFLRF